MRALFSAIAGLAVIVLALGNVPGKTSVVDAAGVQTYSIANVGCYGENVAITLTWASLNQGPQYVYWSTQNNGFQDGTYTASPALPSTANSTVVTVPASPNIYLMIGTVIGGKLEPGQTMVFSTEGLCTGGGAYPGYYGPHNTYDPNFLAQACNLFNQGYTYTPAYPYGHPGYTWNDWDDEDENDWDDESDEDEDDEESDEDEDEDESNGDEGDEGDESDEDEDDESFDEGDEDEDDEDEDEHDEGYYGYGYGSYPGIFAYCLPQYGMPGHSIDWNY